MLFIENQVKKGERRVFDEAIRQLKKGKASKGSALPESYDPKRHYNCFIETVPVEKRQEVYRHLLKKGEISVSHVLPDGRLQLVISLQAGLEALNMGMSVGSDEIQAWEIKLRDLVNSGNFNEALRVMDKMLSRFPNIGALWELKATILTMKGAERDEVGECIERACQLDKNIAKKHKYLAPEERRICIEGLIRQCINEGRDPEQDVAFWFCKFQDFLNAGKTSEAVMCLTIAEQIGPDHYIMKGSDGSYDGVVAPKDLKGVRSLMPSAKFEKVRDFSNRFLANPQNPRL